MQKSPKDLERKVMYRKELQNLLSKNQIDNFFFLYGSDNFQSELYADFIKEKYQADEILKLFFEEYFLYFFQEEYRNHTYTNDSLFILKQSFSFLLFLTVLSSVLPVPADWQIP